MKHAYYYSTRIGRILITEADDCITGLSLITDQEALKNGEILKDYAVCETELLKEASKQLNEYLEGKRKGFNIKLNPEGTVFQKKVWDALLTIPYGETRSYKQIACMVGNERASRAVGCANHNNPIMCMIPCHRVIGADGKLVGFGAGLDIKEQLLKLEKANHTFYYK